MYIVYMYMCIVHVSKCVHPHSPLCCVVTVLHKWPREYERVTELEDVDRNDFVAYTKSKHQRVRDRFERFVHYYIHVHVLTTTL